MSANKGILDRIKQNNGAGFLKNYFHELAANYREEALSYINDNRLSFSSLFILKSEIIKFNLLPHLNDRNKKVLKLSDQLLNREKISFNKLPKKEFDNIHILLSWILSQCIKDDGINSQFDELVDAAAVLLLKVYKDKSFINLIIELIFIRNKRKSFNYDLIWALFETRDPGILFSISQRLYSARWSDTELARKLLKFIPDMENNYHKNNIQQYQYAYKWLNENYPFLYYTGEGFHQSCNPKPFLVSIESKYLCKPLTIGVSTNKRTSYSDKEQKILSEFMKQDSSIKNLLSRYSFLIYNQNIDWWRIWINYPVSEQIKYAKSIGGIQ